MIVECPTCAARYRLSDAVLAKGARLKCAACQHRWVPTAAEALPTVAMPPEPPPKPRPKPLTEADEEAAFAEVQEQLLSRWAEPAVISAPAADAAAATGAAPDPVMAAAEPAPEADDMAAGSGLARSVVAAIAGLALAVIAGGLWLGQTDLGAIPVLGDALGSLETPSPLKLEARGTVTQLPSSRRVLEVTGTIRNPSGAPQPVAALQATLSGPGGVALRWPIPAPVAMLPPGQQVDFASTVTAFPAEAQTLSVSLGR